ncbi:DUF11 domain-containing protein [Alkalinema sp. FACHB-956]|uniref:DUF11 domain-containing protein n=1 Tax=Alkalinema sp. FACHB-956 TaxID=2692768 RepID=UPI001688261D|nr:DUF11 domain-containing protein [Alkalinema sp. FACHB-956]MBD2329351.1 DUF11 domain-containing protein [Alkalinema sp. FACHB-956]
MPPRFCSSRRVFQKIAPQKSTFWLALLVVANGVANPWASAAQAQQVSQPTETYPLVNQAAYGYSTVSQAKYPQVQQFQGVTGQIQSQVTAQLIDPLGRIVGCAGEVLPNYAGFSTALYEANPNDPTGTSLGQLVSLTRTELPDVPNNGVLQGLAPNTENSNPYFLPPSSDGTYNFLLDPNRGQLDIGRTYILVINTPPNSIYSQRRIQIRIDSRNGDVVAYTATSLDGRPVTSNGNQSSMTGSIQVSNAATTSLILAALDLNASVCQAQEVQIVKTADRAAAQPGDTVVYRLTLRNLSSSVVNNLQVTDELPFGFRYREGSAKAEYQKQSLPIQATANGRSLVFNLNGVNLPGIQTIDQVQIINIAYAATLTPDAIRGNGKNLASVQGRRADNQQTVKDGPASHQLRIRPGLLSDCGTLIGRVFEDKNFDGEQQPGEPGIPNAVVILDDGNRITTDANGLFSVANVISGYRTGVLDLSSIPGYTFAPNRKFKERNSQSRLVHLSPGGLVRMNFAVTPAAQEVAK